MMLVMMMMIMGIITDTGAYQDDEGITDDADHGDITDEHGEGLGWTMSCYWQITTQLAYLLLLVIRMNNE